MASRLNPYLSFDGNARAAMEYYRDVFDGTLTLTTFGEFGMTDAELADRVMHAHLETEGGFTLMGSDTAPGMTFEPGNTMSVSLSGDDADELHGYWARLSDGGEVTVPLEVQMWGDEFGMCTDRFGTSWLVNIAQPPAAGGSAA